MFAASCAIDKEDARRISPNQQHERRRQVIRAYKHKVNKRQIARDVGLSYSETYKIIDRYEAGGMAVGGTRQKLSMLAGVNNQGKARWIIIDGNFNHEKLIEFFNALIDDTQQKVFLILDNLGVHHCKPAKEWLAIHVEEIEVFYLPNYSPESNPEERLNADLKHVIRSKVPARTKAKLRAATEDHMATIGQAPERVKAYFQDPLVKYAA